MKVKSNVKSGPVVASTSNAYMHRDDFDNDNYPR